MNIPTPSTKNTKTEILDAYNELLEKLKSKETNLKTQQQKEETKETTLKVKEQNGDKIIQDIASLKTKVSSVLDQVENLLLDEFRKVENFSKVSASEEIKLQNIFQISHEAESLEAIIQAHKLKKEELEAEMSESRERWKMEREKMKLEYEEWKNDWQKTRTREEEEYAYNLNLSRKKEEDAYLVKKAKMESDLEEWKMNVESALLKREANMGEKEQEYRLLKEKAENFDKELELAIKNAIEKTEKELTKTFDFEKKLMQQEVEGNKKLWEQSLLSLKQKNNDLENQLKDFTQKLDVANLQVKEMALKALDASSARYMVNREYEAGTKAMN